MWPRFFRVKIDIVIRVPSYYKGFDHTVQSKWSWSWQIYMYCTVREKWPTNLRGLRASVIRCLALSLSRCLAVLALSRSRSLVVSPSRCLALSPSRSLAVSPSRPLALSLPRSLAVSLSRCLAFSLSRPLAVSPSRSLRYLKYQAWLSTIVTDSGSIPKAICSNNEVLDFIFLIFPSSVRSTAPSIRYNNYDRAQPKIIKNILIPEVSLIDWI